MTERQPIKDNSETVTVLPSYWIVLIYSTIIIIHHINVTRRSRIECVLTVNIIISI